MSDSALSTPVPAGTTAGTLLREAREKQGMHIAVLAAAIKISPRKLDALEGDRYDELPDATFARALAQTVCRALKIDPAPVLALLPSVQQKTLDTVGDGLNTPFRDRASGTDLSAMLPRAPLLWAALALLGAAALVYYWPSGTPSVMRPSQPQATQAPRAPSNGAPGAAAGATTQPGAPLEAAKSDPLATPAAAASAAMAPTTGSTQSAAVVPATAPALPAAGATPAVDSSARPPFLPALPAPSATGASVAVSEPVWLEVTDSSGQVLFQRTIQPGETLSFDQAPPLRLKIGNATAAKLSFRGEPVDLVPFTRGSVARVVLK
jgi:cytoskeleton protein RodZ